MTKTKTFVSDRRVMRPPKLMVPNKRPLPPPKSVQLNLESIKLEPTTFNRPKPETDEKQQYINPENIIKALDNGHALVMLKRTRVKGFCVECIKKRGDPGYKKTMTKIITYCPQCPVSYNFLSLDNKFC